MKFQFESLADFLAMSGHGPYVWASYAITFIALIFLVVNPVLQQRALIKQQKKLRKLAQGAPEPSSIR
ncbi:heme exporter protein CcmD [Cellvibrio mixtus]|jgi:heme exporter protein D|uniref:Heme exporter protein D n=1 Tax=Cellvibrio mixtus TaxID=39650 RepID=A0A266Q5D8_9GAMM|nr:heme exporter protein CcmD [Cellvibrio mixtus]OZY85098.1 heme exporter protein CcmD [Cellvibrio mixtus]